MIISNGFSNGKQLVKYDISNDSFMDYGADYLSASQFGYGIDFTQLDDKLYSLRGFSVQANMPIIVYDLQTLSMSNFNLSFEELDVHLPITVNQYACMTSSNAPSPRLYITGGENFGYLSDFQILTLDDLQWVTYLPSMLNTHTSHGSAVVNDRLWVIGGRYESSVEAIITTNVTTESWNNIGSLPCELSEFGITAAGGVIFIVGGWCWDLGGTSSIIYTIDTATNVISVNPNSLPYGVNGMAVVAIDNTIYGFGGHMGKFIDFWGTLDLLRIL